LNINNFVDRTSISVLAPAIQAEFGLSDTLIGLVMGIAFTAFLRNAGLSDRAHGRPAQSREDPVGRARTVES
jgi:hypothetical protein